MAERQIQVTVGSVTDKKKLVVSSGSTLRSAFKESGIEYAGGMIQLDGVNIGVGDLDRSFDDLGIVGEEALLISIIKGDNA